MTGRSRHGLHVVRDGETPPGEPDVPSARGRLLLSLQQRSVVLAIGGRLDADTAGRLRMFLSMFSVEGGPRELVLDLSDVFSVDEEGMAPVFEAEEAMRLRAASLRLAGVSAAVALYLDDVRCDRTLVTGPPLEPAAPDPVGGPGAPPLDDDRPSRGRD
jgi:anti-anti-sigma factor